MKLADMVGEPLTLAAARPAAHVSAGPPAALALPPFWAAEFRVKFPSSEHGSSLRLPQLGLGFESSESEAQPGLRLV